jgi:hypothetical protein
MEAIEEFVRILEVFYCLERNNNIKPLRPLELLCVGADKLYTGRLIVFFGIFYSLGRYINPDYGASPCKTKHLAAVSGTAGDVQNPFPSYIARRSLVASAMYLKKFLTCWIVRYLFGDEAFPCNGKLL